jgi:hypothetical protein
VASGNVGSRLATIQAIVEHSSFSIDNTIFMGDGSWHELDSQPHLQRTAYNWFNGTNDKICVGGKFYSDKPPMLSFLASGIYFFLYYFGVSFGNAAGTTVYLLTCLTSGLLASLMLVFFYKSLLFVNIENKYRLLLTLLLGLSTLVFTYAVTFNNHIIAASLVYMSFYFLLKMRFTKDYGALVYAGFLLGFSAAIDMPFGLVFLSFFGLYVIYWVRGIKRIALHVSKFVLASFIVLLLHCAVNLNITGSLLPGSLHPEYWNYPGAEFNEETLSGMTRHESVSGFAIYSFNTLFGLRGFFSYTPLLLFSLAGLMEAIKSKRWRTEGLAVGGGSAVVVFFYLFSSSNYGGWSYGMRWFVPLVPLIFFFTAFLFKKPFSKVGWFLFWIAAAWSVLTAIVGVYQPWTEMWRTASPFLNNLIEIMQHSIKKWFPDLWRYVKYVLQWFTDNFLNIGTTFIKLPF